MIVINNIIIYYHKYYLKVIIFVNSKYRHNRITLLDTRKSEKKSTAVVLDNYNVLSHLLV